MAQRPTSAMAQALAIMLVASLLLLGWTKTVSSRKTKKSSNGGDDDDAETESEFETWARRFGKNETYGHNQSLRQKRLSTFKANLERIRRHNRRNSSSYTLAVNRFADLTFAELQSTLLLGKQLKAPPPELLKSSSAAINSSLRAAAACNPAALPANFDWRSRGKVTDVKDQGRCGSCWAFASVATIESAYAIKTGKLYRLSEQELVSCETRYSSGCQGGYIPYAMLWVRDNGGIDSQADYPYVSGTTGTRGTCDYVKVRTKKVASISAVGVVATSNEAALQCVVAQQPVAISIYANSDFMRYGGGIFDAGPSCPYQVGSANHAITFVGWGQTSSGLKYWIAKNSWGKSWGVGGYVYIRRGTSIPQGVCGVNNYPYVPIA